MSPLLTLLAWSPVLPGLYIALQALLYRLEHGFRYSAGGRDDEPPAQSPYLQRSEKALRNLLETYGAFVALAAVAVLGHRDGTLAQWGGGLYFAARIAYLPLYLFAVRYLRSLVWTVSAFGLALMFWAVIR